jgi:hypothetical protein
MGFRISKHGWTDFYEKLLHKREQGRDWLHENLQPGESFNISIINDGLCLLVSVRAVEGDKTLQRFSEEVMPRYEMHGLECKNGVWSARFPFSVPIERGTYDEVNFTELLAHIAYIRQVEGLVEDGRMTADTASQFFQQSLEAIEQINRTL